MAGLEFATPAACNRESELLHVDFIQALLMALSADCLVEGLQHRASSNVKPKNPQALPLANRLSLSYMMKHTWSSIMIIGKCSKRVTHAETPNGVGA